MEKTIQILKSLEKNREDYETVPDEEKEKYKDNLQEAASELNKINNTNGFNIALMHKFPEAAEAFVNRVKTERVIFKNYDDRWIGHREREVIKKYKELGNWKAAKKAIENMHIPTDPNDPSVEETAKTNKVNRMNQLAKDSGIEYDAI